MRISSAARIIVLLSAAGSAGCYDPNRITAPDEVFAITASPERIPADGFSTSQITVRVNPATNRALKFSFTNSGGTLSVPSAQTRGPDANGEIVAFLTSDATPKTVLVTSEARDGNDVVASRSVSVTFEAAAPSSVIRLTASSSQVDADGVSSVQLRAEASPALAARSVNFKTTNGSFVRNANPAVTDQSVPTGSDGVAVAQLYATSGVGTALVTATSGGFSATETITFAPALPDFISLSATPLEQSRASEANTIALRALLSRAVGTVTQNTRVDFTAVNDESGASFGRFQNVTRSNGSEEVTAQFVPGTAAPLGLATITARVPGTEVSARVKVNIIP